MREPVVIVEFSDVSFGYPPEGLARAVLVDVDLAMARGDVLGVIGPNGGGKTTLLRLMLGLEKPQRGAVRVFGGDPVAARPRVSYVPQHATIDVDVPATVLDVALAGRLRHAPWGARYARADVDAAREALARTGMDGCEKRRFGSLSGGQRQRVLIARGLASQAEILLLDEPTSGVDVPMQAGLTELLRVLGESLSIVVVSHELTLIADLAERVAIVRRSVVVHDRAADEVTLARWCREPIEHGAAAT